MAFSKHFDRRINILNIFWKQNLKETKKKKKHRINHFGPTSFWARIKEAHNVAQFIITSSCLVHGGIIH